MSEKLKPSHVSRDELEELMVTEADAFTAQKYLHHRRSVPRLPELESEGSQKVPGAAGALADLYYSLWAPEPEVKDESEVPADREYWRQLLDEAMNSSKYEQLHSKTKLSSLESVMGTIAMGEKVLTVVPDEDAEKLEEIEQAQVEADELEDEAQQAQRQADQLEMLAERAQEDANQQGDSDCQQGESGQPGSSGQSQSDQSGQSSGQSDAQPNSSSGSPGSTQSGQSQAGSNQRAQAGGMSSTEAKQRANELAQQAAEAQAKADELKSQAQQAQSKAEQIKDDLMGELGSEQAQRKKREMARMAQSALKEAEQQVQEVSETVQAWGLDEGELTRENFSDLQRLQEELKQNPALEKFTKLLGRLRKIAANKARSKDQGEGVKRPKREYGRDIKRAVTSELTALTHPALRAKAYKRWARGELRLEGEETRRKLGRGPVIVCEDASGSMSGEKQKWTKALILALAHFAKLRSRDFGWVLFDTYVRKSNTYPSGQLSVDQLLEIAETSAGGGTDFEAPLEKASAMIKQDQLERADILLVTDGMCAVSDEFLEDFLNLKEELDFTVFTLLVNVGDTTDETVEEFSDHLVPISELTAQEAEDKVIGRL